MGDFTNIYEVLNEPEKGKKGQKQQAKQQKQQANQAPKAAPKKEAPVARDQNQGQGRGNRPRGGERGRGGRGEGGRGRGQGRGRGGGQGRREIDHNGPRGQDGRDHSRRQRENQMQRGDYGNPDNKGRMKRPYDKFSHSHGARSGKADEKKGGHGAHNWGARGDVEGNAEPNAEEEKEVVVNEKEEKDADDKAEGEGKEEAAEEEEEEKEIGYDAYLERKKKEDEELTKLDAGGEIRKVDASELDGLKVLNKKEEDFGFGAPKECKKKKKGNASKRGGNVQVDEVLNCQQRDRDDRRGRRDDRRRNDGNRQRRHHPNLALADDSDFPSLKA